jgi:UPF0716 family protein affecting phage T7 exclusion
MLAKRHMGSFMGMRKVRVHDSDDRWRSLTGADRLALAVGVICLLAGVVLVAAVPGFVVSVIGACLLGLAGIAFVALAFLLVGEGEERDYRQQ